MIVYEREHDFVMVSQYDHSILSGEICSLWNPKYFIGMNRWDDVMVAIREHDRCWIDLDDTPLLNDARHTPYTFMDIPLKLKLLFYRNGIDEMQKENKYAALLQSMHFASFFNGAPNIAAKQFYEQEQERQRNLLNELAIDSDIERQQLNFHFRLLQFGDDISIYVCFHEPGTPKEDEISWYKEGFPQAFLCTDKKIVATWIDPEHISLSPFPFLKEGTVTVKIKEVAKTTILAKGLGKAYKETDWTERKVTLVEGS